MVTHRVAHSPTYRPATGPRSPLTRDLPVLVSESGLEGSRFHRWRAPGPDRQASESCFSATFRLRRQTS